MSEKSEATTFMRIFAGRDPGELGVDRVGVQ